MARNADPTSVPKNQYNNPIIKIDTMMPIIRANVFADIEIISLKVVIIVSSPNREVFACPIIRILIEYKAIIVKIPDKISGILTFVCRIPVIPPANAPANKAGTNASHGFTPFTIKIALTAPPSAKLPSTVISAKFNILNVMYTPSVIMPHNTPCEMAPSIANKMFI